MRFTTAFAYLAIAGSMVVAAAPMPFPEGNIARGGMSRDKREATAEPFPGGGRWGGKRDADATAEPEALPGGSAWGGR